jgi:hypothetical protein
MPQWRLTGRTGMKCLHPPERLVLGKTALFPPDPDKTWLNRGNNYEQQINSS